MVFSSPFTLSAFQGRSSFYWLIAAIFKQLLQLINVVGFSVYAMCTLHEPEDIHVDMKKLTWQYTPISIKVALGFGHWNTEYNAMLCLSDHQTIAFEVKARFPKQPLLKQVYTPIQYVTIFFQGKRMVIRDCETLVSKFDTETWAFLSIPGPRLYF